MGDALPLVRSYLERSRRHVSGPMLLLVLIVIIEALARTPLRLPNPTPFLLLAVVYSAFMDDRARATLTTLVAIAHTTIYFSAPGTLLQYDADDAYRVLVIVFVAPVMAAMTFVLKERAALLERERGARHAAERERDFVRLVIANSPHGVIVTRGSDHFVELVNPAAEALLHVAHAALVGRPVVTISPTFYTDVQRVLDTAVTEGQTQRVPDVALQLPDGERANVELTAVPLAEAPAKKLGLLLILTDLSARKRAEDELAAARRELLHSERLATMGAMLSGVAHEIRTPLALINNSVHVVRSRIERERDVGKLPEALETAPRLLDDALAGVDRANELVRDLRRFVRVEPTARAEVDLPEVAREALRLFAATHPGAQPVRAQLTEVPPVLGDPRHLQQVVLNLVENAVAAAGPGGHVEVRVATQGDDVELIVADDGPGMPPAVRARAFDAFFTTKQEGTGLGLAIVKRLVEAHGGRVECESEADRGTTFRVTIPHAKSAVSVRVLDPPSAT